MHGIPPAQGRLAAWPTVVSILTVLVLALAPGASAAFAGTHAYEDDLAFPSDLTAGHATFLSGRVSMSLDDVDGGMGFLGTGGLAVRELERVCWDEAGQAVCVGPGAQIVVSDGASVAMRLPGRDSGLFQARHALAILQDLSGQGGALADSDLGPSLIMSAIDGTMRFNETPIIPSGGLTPDLEASGALILLGNGSLAVRLAGEEVYVQRDGASPVLFEGHPRMDPFRLDGAVLPVGPGAFASWSRADDAAAAAGVDQGRLDALFATLNGASDQSGGSTAQGAGAEAGEGGTSEPEAGGGLQLPDGLLGGLLNGALVRVPMGQAHGEDGGFQVEQLVLVRFESMEMVGLDGSAHVEATAPLVLKDGKLSGAKSMVGSKWFALPWWSIVLWVAAIGVMVTRMVVGPEKKLDRDRRFGWIGWVTTLVATVLVFWLWDREVKDVLGFSVLGGSADVGTGILLVIELGLLSMILFATAVPLGIILRNGLMLARQGNVMGLHRPVATIAGFFIGVTLLVSYLQMILTRVLEAQ